MVSCHQVLSVGGGNWLRDHGRDSIVIGPKGEYSNEYFMNENWIKM